MVPAKSDLIEEGDDFPIARLLADANATVYLSGPMTGYPEWNFPAFEDAARRLRSIGLAVISPHEKDLQDGFDPSSDGQAFDLRAALEWDIAAVQASDAVIVLPGWEDSPGAVIEVTVAEALGRPVFAFSHILAMVARVKDVVAVA